MGCICSKPKNKISAVSTHPAAISNWTHLAFSGGGANGIMYVGAYRAAWDIGVIAGIQGAVGTSVGSIFATFAAMQIYPDLIQQYVSDLDTTRLLDNNWFPIEDLVDFTTKLGFYRGDYLEEWCEKIIAEHSGKAHCTFAELYARTARHLKICVCNETLARVEYWDHITRPDIPIARAIRTSSSIPFVYDPVHHGTHLYIDGGVCDIFPLKAFGNVTTLGFLLLQPNERESSQLVVEQQVNGLVDHALAVYRCMSAAQFALQHPGEEWTHRTVALHGAMRSLWKVQFTDAEKVHWIHRSYTDAYDDIQSMLLKSISI